MGFLLFIISFILSIVLYPVGFLYATIKLAINTHFDVWINKLSDYLKISAISVDKTGNVFMQELFNDLLIIKGGYKFGVMNETISSVLGKNKRDNTLSFCGRMLAKLLNFFQSEHVEKSIEKNTF